VRVTSAAAGRAEYLKRPDLGRRLAAGTDLEPGEYDVVLVLADGLSPLAVQNHGVPMLAAILSRLDGWRVAPVVIATEARVALGDEVASAIGARSVVVLVGERPGMSSTDSLGIYFTFDARRGRRDSERNCLSNIRPPHGTGYEAAATTLAMLMAEARRLGLSGVALKADPALGTS
jgi:ethanolamine ammonia-lyase small subunit